MSNLATVEKIEETMQTSYNESDFLGLNPETKDNSDICMGLKSSRMLNVYRQASRLKKVRLSLLLTGEEGTGKRSLAEWISEEDSDTVIRITAGSHRRKIMDSIERSIPEHCSTIIVERIDLMDISALESLYRIASASKDVRLILTARSSENMQAELYRELLHKINGIHIHIPALNERPEDIEPLVSFFLEQFYDESGLKRSCNDSLLEYLQSVEWSENIRGLKQAIYHAALRAEDQSLQVEDFDVPGTAGLESFRLNDLRRGFHTIIRDYERRVLREALRYCSGNRSGAARLLDLNRGTLIQKIKLYRLEDEIPAESQSRR